MTATPGCGPLDQPRVRTRVIRQLARGTSYAALAHQHRVTQASVIDFAIRHRVRIRDVAARIDSWDRGGSIPDDG